jgi:hypothetical protein
VGGLNKGTNHPLVVPPTTKLSTLPSMETPTEFCPLAMYRKLQTAVWQAGSTDDSTKIKEIKRMVMEHEFMQPEEEQDVEEPILPVGASLTEDTYKLYCPLSIALLVKANDKTKLLLADTPKLSVSNKAVAAMVAMFDPNESVFRTLTTRREFSPISGFTTPEQVWQNAGRLLFVAAVRHLDEHGNRSDEKVATAFLECHKSGVRKPLIDAAIVVTAIFAMLDATDPKDIMIVEQALSLVIENNIVVDLSVASNRWIAETLFTYRLWAALDFVHGAGWLKYDDEYGRLAISCEMDIHGSALWGDNEQYEELYTQFSKEEVFVAEIPDPGTPDAMSIISAHPCPEWTIVTPPLYGPVVLDDDEEEEEEEEGEEEEGEILSQDLKRQKC